MGGERGARRAALLAPDLGPIGGVDRLGLACQEGGLLRAEQLGQKQPALAVEELDLLRRQLHGVLPLGFLGEPPGLFVGLTPLPKITSSCLARSAYASSDRAAARSSCCRCI